MRKWILLRVFLSLSISAAWAQEGATSEQVVLGGDEYVSLKPMGLERELLSGKMLSAIECNFGGRGEAVYLASLYCRCERRDNLLLLRCDSTSYVVDDKGMARAELVSPRAPIWLGEHLFPPTRCGVIQVDVSGFSENRCLQPDAFPLMPVSVKRRKFSSYSALIN